MYAKEMIKPKLQQLDQEKLARLYADLRRESLATGSFPITVRHLESMIRMSEASAKMNLREYVRSDDIDLAIQVTVGSFVNAQKMSIKKTLERVSGQRNDVVLHKTHALTGRMTLLRDSANTSTRPLTTRSCSRSSLDSSSRRRSNFTSTNTTGRNRSVSQFRCQVSIRG